MSVCTLRAGRVLRRVGDALPVLDQDERQHHFGAIADSRALHIQKEGRLFGFAATYQVEPDTQGGFGQCGGWFT